ncbi:AfsR/SARP family transcriptional regulator (plasmid) [Rhizobium leguminosarum]
MIRVTLFGRFTAGSEQCQVHLRDGSKAQELFAYVLLGGRRSHTREALANLLWSDCSTETSRAYLRKALWQLRSALEQCEPFSPAFLKLDSEWIQIRPDSPLWVDVLLFERAYCDSCNLDAESLGEQVVDAMQEAVELYGDGLLPNRYESWCVAERERYRTMYLWMRGKLMDYWVGRRQYENAIEQGKQILHCDSSHERTHQRIMWLYHVKQDRTRALGQYEACKEALAAELGVEPSRQTTDLYRAVRDNAAPVLPFHGLYAPNERSLEPPAISSFRGQIRELSSNLTELQRSVEALLTEVESYSNGTVRDPLAPDRAAVSKAGTSGDTSAQRMGTSPALGSTKQVIRSKHA